jgi:hypothetical protein
MSSKNRRGFLDVSTTMAMMYFIMRHVLPPGAATLKIVTAPDRVYSTAVSLLLYLSFKVVKLM